MTVTRAPLGSAEHERLAALASEIEAARGRHAPPMAVDRHVALADRRLDLRRLADAVREVTDVLVRRGALTDEETAAVRDRAALDRDVRAVIAWAARGDGPPPFPEAPAVWSVVRLVLPTFVGAGATDDETETGVCPECGMRPDLAVLTATGARHLVCGACDTEWCWDRIRCPFCGTADQDRMAYLVGGAPGYVLRVCDACRTYLKTIDRRALDGDETPLLLRLLSAEMDLAAERSGYRPAS